MDNNLQLQIGPQLVENCLPIAFISSAGFNPESLAIFSEQQYVVDNIPRVRSLSFNPSGMSVISATASVSFEAISSLGISASSLSLGDLSVENNAITFKHLSSPILINGVFVNPDKSFTPSVGVGNFLRTYTMQSEPAWSWLPRAGFAEGDKLLLVYGVPEVSYQTFTAPSSTDTLFPNTACLSQVIEDTYPATPTTINLKHVPEYLISVVAEGSTLYSGKLQVGETSAEIRDFTANGVVNLVCSLDPDTKVTVTYLTQPQTYNYKGFKFYDGTNTVYKGLDLNPEYGRRSYSDVSSAYVSSLKALYDEVQIYLVPVAAAKLNFTETSKGVFTGSIEFKSAFNYGETHFVRHYVGPLDEDFNEDYSLTVREFFNYWGTTVLGQAEYDDLGAGPNTNDVFSTYLPSMAPIGKITLARGGKNDQISIIDLRNRGGGINSIESLKGSKYSDTLFRQLQQFFDLGTWGGVSLHQGGIVKIEIAKTVLDQFSQEEVDNIVKFHIPVGMDYFIQYTE